MSEMQTFTESESAKEFIKSLCLGNIEACNLFMSCMKNNEAISILSSLFDSRPPSIYVPVEQARSSLHLKWMESRLLKLLNGKDVMDLSYEPLVVAELRQVKDKVVGNFLAAFIDYAKSSRDESKLVILIQSFLALNREYEAAAVLFLPEVEGPFRSVQFSYLVENFGLNSFNLFGSVETVAAARDVQFAYTSFADCASFFQAPTGYAVGRMFRNVQTGIVKSKLYPAINGYEDHSRIRTLIESAIVTNVHFIDMVRTCSKANFEKGQYQIAYKIASDIGMMSVWIFLSHRNDIGTLFPNIKDRVPEILNGTSIANVFLNRIINDSKFLAGIKRLTGQRVELEDLKEQSYPFIMQDLLSNQDQMLYQEFQDTPLFCLSDRQKDIDADFLLGQAALRLVMTAMENESWKVPALEWCVGRIKDRGTQQSILVDLFSLLFVQKDGMPCSLGLAERILSVILNTSDNEVLMKYAQIGLTRVQIAKSVGGESARLNTVLVPRTIQLLDALHRQDWQIAGYIAGVDDKSQRLVSVYKSVVEFAQQKVVTISDTETAAEICLSYENQKLALERAREGSWSSEVKTLLDIRAERNCANEMKCYKTLAKKYFYSVDRMLSNFSTVSWETPSFPKLSTKLVHLPGFMRYLDAFVPALLKHGLANSVFDALATNAMSALERLMRNGKADDAEVLARELKVNVMDMIVSDDTYPSSLVEHFIEKSPTCGVALLFSRGETCDENFVKEDCTLRRIVGTRVATADKNQREQNEALRKTLMGEPSHYVQRLSPDVAYKVNQHGISEEEVWSSIAWSWSRGDLGRVAELSYLVPVRDFSDLLFQKADNAMFEDVLTVANMSAVSPELSDCLDFLVEIRDKYSPLFPLNETLERIIGNREYGLATQFVRLMENHVNCYSVIGKCLEAAPEEDKPRILMIWPAMRAHLVREYGPIDSPSEHDGAIISEDFIVRTLQRDMNEVVDLAEKKGLDLDSFFIDHIKQLPNVRSAALAMKRFYRVCRNRRAALEALTSPLSQKISGFRVFDVESEFALESTLIQLQQALSRYGESDMLKKTEVLHEVIQYGPNRFNGFSYSMASMGIELVRIAAELDLMDIVKKMLLLWQISDKEREELYGGYILTCSKLSVSLSNFEQQLLALPFFGQLLVILKYCPFFDPSVLGKLENPFPPAVSEEREISDLLSAFYQRLEKIAEKGDKADRKEDDELLTYFVRNSPAKLVAQYYAEKEDFEKAVEVLQRVVNVKEKTAIFRDSVLETAIAYNSFDKLRPKMKDNQLLFKEMIPVAGPHLRYEIEMGCGMYREACQIALDLFPDAKTPERTLVYLDMAQNALESEPNRTDEDIARLTGIGIQRLIIALVKEKKLGGTVGLHLFGDDGRRIAMVTMLFLSNEFDLAITIIQTYSLDSRLVGERAIDAMLNESEESLIAFIKQMERKCRQNKFNVMFRGIVYAMIMRLTYVFKRTELTKSCILSITNADFKARLFLQFSYIEEAAELVLENNLSDLLPLVAYYGRENPRNSVLKCMKQLTM